MLVNGLGIFRQIDAEGLVVGNVAVLPLNVLTKLVDGLVGGARRPAELHERHLADARNVAFDDVTLHLGHDDEGTLPPRYAAAAIPAAEAAIAHRRGEHDKVLEVLLPARRNLWMMGGSHAQQDVFQQMLFDSAQRSGRDNLLPILLSEVAEDGFEAIAARSLYGEAARQAAPAA